MSQPAALSGKHALLHPSSGDKKSNSDVEPNPCEDSGMVGLLLARLWQRGALLQPGPGLLELGVPALRGLTADAAPGCRMELLRFSIFAQGLGLALHLIAARLQVWSHIRFPHLPAVTQPQRGRIRAGSSAVAPLIADCTLDPQGTASGVCQAAAVVPRELGELPPPKQASPCVRVCRLLANHV